MVDLWSYALGVFIGMTFLGGPLLAVMKSEGLFKTTEKQPKLSKDERYWQKLCEIERKY